MEPVESSTENDAPEEIVRLEAPLASSTLIVFEASDSSSVPG